MFSCGRFIGTVLLLAAAFPIIAGEPTPGQLNDNAPAPSSDIREREDVDARTRDYLLHHGDNGVIDPALLLRRTREFSAEFERDRRIRALAINGNAWVSLGPTNGAGRTLSIAVDPTVAGSAIIGTAGGG